MLNGVAVHTAASYSIKETEVCNLFFEQVISGPARRSSYSLPSLCM